jgi:predicted membrane protein
MLLFLLAASLLYDNETRWSQNEYKIYCHLIFFCQFILYFVFCLFVAASLLYGNKTRWPQNEYKINWQKRSNDNIFVLPSDI